MSNVISFSQELKRIKNIPATHLFNLSVRLDGLFIVLDAYVATDVEVIRSLEESLSQYADNTRIQVNITNIRPMNPGDDYRYLFLNTHDILKFIAERVENKQVEWGWFE